MSEQVTEDPDSQRKVFEALNEAVLRKRPILREIITKHGNKRLIDYASLYTDVNLNPPIQQRQDELLGTFSDEVKKRFGESVAREAAQQLGEHYFISTTDHHGPIVNPSFCNANLLTTATYAEHHDPHLKYVIVFPCSNVSLNNITFPRGLVFHSLVDGQPKLQRLSFLPSNAHSAVVYNFRPYTLDEIKKIRRVIDEKQKNNLITAKTAERLYHLIDTVYIDTAVLEQPTYSDQMIIANARLWDMYFQSSHTHPSQLLYLDQEGITAELLCRYHLFADTIINHMLFDAAYAPLLEHYFRGIMGAFDERTNYGTYFFWGISKENQHRIQMWKHGTILASKDGRLTIPFEPEAIAKALQEKQLMPSLLLVFSVLCFYYGLKCLGGFNQVNYLTAMKNAYIKMNVDRGNYRSIEVCARAQTKEMNDGYLVAFLQAPNGRLIPATGLDLYLYGDERTWPTIYEGCKNTTIAESLGPAMPEFYRYVYTEADRDETLSSLTPEQIAAMSGLTKKVQPCIQLA